MSYALEVIVKNRRPTDEDFLCQLKENHRLFVAHFDPPSTEIVHFLYDSLEKTQAAELSLINWAGEAGRLDDVEIRVVVRNPEADRLSEMYQS